MVSDLLSVSEFAIRFLTHSTHGPQPQRRVSNPAERGWVTEVQLTAAAAQHGHGSDWVERVRQHYTVASAHCAKWVSLPSAKLELMIRISPQTFGGEPSAYVRPGISRFLADLRPRLPTARLWRPPLLWMGVRVGVDTGIPWRRV